jgi:hypothetical protein
MTIEHVPTRKFRQGIPDIHRTTLDTRLVWLWNQRFGTVQTIWQNSNDVLDKTACTLILQAIMGSDLESISQLFQRLEGGAMKDTVLQDQDTLRL